MQYISPELIDCLQANYKEKVMRAHVAFSKIICILSGLYGVVVILYPFTAFGDQEITAVGGIWVNIWWLLCPMLCLGLSLSSWHYSTGGGYQKRGGSALFTASTAINGAYAAAMMVLGIYLCSYFGELSVLPFLGILQIIFSVLQITYSYWSYRLTHWMKISLPKVQ